MAKYENRRNKSVYLRKNNHDGRFRESSNYQTLPYHQGRKDNHGKVQYLVWHLPLVFPQSLHFPHLIFRKCHHLYLLSNNQVELSPHFYHKMLTFAKSKMIISTETLIEVELIQDRKCKIGLNRMKLGCEKSSEKRKNPPLPPHTKFTFPGDRAHHPTVTEIQRLTVYFCWSFERN